MVPNRPDPLFGKTIAVEQGVFVDHVTEDSKAAPLTDAVPLVLPRSSISKRLQSDPGTANGRYQIEGMLGLGSTGEVYTVRDLDLQRLIAVKVLRQDLLGSAEEIASFVSEARTTACLAHPNVLPLLDADLTADGRPYFTMNRILGQTLAQLLEQPCGVIAALGSLNRLVSIMISICHAIAYAHAQGVIHQDVKPENILIGDFGEVLLLDWGSARKVDDQGRVQGRLYGTPLYMSPEQARKSHADARSDIYAVGGTLLHALIGRVPLWTDDSDAFWSARRSGRINPITPAERAGVPGELLDIALKALAAEPEQRYASMTALRIDLENYQTGLAVSAHRDSLARALWRFYRRHRWQVWSVAAGLVMLLGTALVLYREWQQQQASWHLVLSEDFDHGPEALAPIWKGQFRDLFPEQNRFQELPFSDSGSWTIQDGHLRIDAKNGELDLTCRRRFPADLRVEWQVLLPTSALNANCYLGSDRTRGYTFHVGGFGDPTSVVLTQGPEYVRLAWNHIRPLQPGIIHHFALERLGLHLSLTIDGERVIDYAAFGLQEPDTSTFGFDQIGSPQELSKIRVFTRRPPQQVSPLVAGDALFSAKDFAAAHQRYLEIADAYPGSDLAASAQFDIAMCLLRSGDDDGGVNALSAFEAAHPNHEMVPFSMEERLRIAIRRHDAATEQAIREHFVRFRGHYLLRRVIGELSEERCDLLQPLPVAKIGDRPYALDIDRQVVSAIDEISHWASLYGVSTDGSRFMYRASSLMAQLGFDRIVLERLPSGSPTASALYDMGRFQAILDNPDFRSVLGVQVLISECRFDEVLNGPYSDDDKAWARSSRDQQQSSEHPPAPEVMAAAAAREVERQKRAAEAWLQNPSGFIHELLPSTLIRAGHDDELLAQYPYATHEAMVVALHRLAAGRTQEGKALLRLLAPLPINHLESGGAVDQAFVDYFAPLMLSHDEGAAMDLHHSLHEILAGGREAYAQEIWYMASLLDGSIDEAAFLQQPVRFLAANRLRIVQGMLAELRSDRARAIAAYQGVPLPNGGPQCIPNFVAWRLHLLRAGP
jgi:hypothetical protein